MALEQRQGYVAYGADPAAATIAANANPDGSTYALNVAVTSGPTSGQPSGQQVTANSTGVALSSAACRAVIVQNRLNDDSNTAQTQDVLVKIGSTNTIQLVPGQSERIETDNANRLTVLTFSGTAIVAAVVQT
jgi:hypothetical protein